ncbi:hypothetical protein B0J15DRAFT_496556 [Fusarium solani]|uniref:Uncharacterized protein n=1 Tax=Fusarium solani TaxID=169388 RepID=A0A9P9H599_FUSSL|nr:uncharacterized protein B0J15DRAFT_496556 [Fusarium solani]KAH7250625.1 hypothetical protein B0J15DRAFT_496556 [Fusarium solani]
MRHYRGAGGSYPMSVKRVYFAWLSAQQLTVMMLLLLLISRVAGRHQQSSIASFSINTDKPPLPLKTYRKTRLP